jgi:P27 family predicted phage terminase small subunit
VAIRGQKPKPSHLRIVDGNASRRPLNENEPKPTVLAADTQPPPGLSAPQQEFWRAKFAEVPVGMLTVVDLPLFTAYVMACWRYQNAITNLTTTGELIKVGEGWMHNPYGSVVNRQARDISKFASELGFSPTSRTRVKIDRRTKKSSPFGELKGLDD